MSFCRKRQLFARGDADLLLHDVDAGDHFGHRVLDLDAGVHLDEVELAVLVEELEGAGAAVADLAAGLGAAFADLVAQFRGQVGRGRFLDDLLVAALHASSRARRGRPRSCARRRAPGSRCGAGSRGISPCRPSGCRTRRCASGTRHVDRVQQRGLGMHHAHAAPAAAAGRLDDDRVADAARDRARSRARPPAARPRSPARTARRPSTMACLALTLSPIRRMFSGRGPMKTKPERLDPLGEVGVFGQKTVAGMDGLGVGDFGRAMIAGMLR